MEKGFICYNFLLGIDPKITGMTNSVFQRRYNCGTINTGGGNVGQNPKSSRVLEIYQQFVAGKIVSKRDLAERYGVNDRSIQRDIDTIRDFLSEQATQKGVIQTIEYDTKEKGFKLVTQDISGLSPGEMLAACKILVESRAFSKDQLDSLLGRMLSLCVSPKEKEQIEGYVANEVFNYLDPAHLSIDPETLWKIEAAIQGRNVLEVSYRKLKGGETVVRKIDPVGLLFSEYYFYLMGVIEDEDTKAHFEVTNDPHPTIYRIDRIENLKVLAEQFPVSYQSRFQEGEYKNISHYMSGGPVSTIKFKCGEKTIEAALDRFPKAKIVEQSEGGYLVSADAFVRGFVTWAMSQGDKVQIIGPEWVRDMILEEYRKALQSTDNT